jgi:hypothetical protein
MSRRGLRMSLGAMALCACQTPAAQAESPAVLIEPDEAARTELRAAVADLLQAPEVLLAPDAFTRSSTLQIEPRGLAITGRDYGRPQTVMLLRRDGACVLLHGADRRVLSQARCGPFQE